VHVRVSGFYGPQPQSLQLPLHGDLVLTTWELVEGILNVLSLHQIIDPESLPLHDIRRRKDRSKPHARQSGTLEPKIHLRLASDQRIKNEEVRCIDWPG